MAFISLSLSHKSFGIRWVLFLLQKYIRRDGLDYILTGAGSQVRPVRPVEGTQFCTSISGFTAVRVGPESLSFEFRSHTGARLYGAALTRA